MDTPFTSAISSTVAIDMTTEEETKDSGNDLPGSSGYDQLSSALSATSTSMISLEDTPTEFSIGGEDKKKQTQKRAVERSSLNLLTGMQPSPRQSKIPQGSSTAHKPPSGGRLEISDKSLVILAKPTTAGSKDQADEKQQSQKEESQEKKRKKQNKRARRRRREQ